MQAFESDFSYKDIKDSIQSFKRKKNAINFKKIILLGILSLITIILGTSVLMTKWNIKQLKVQFSSLKEKNDEVVLKKTTIEKEIELLQKENNELKDKITSYREPYKCETCGVKECQLYANGCRNCSGWQ